MNYLVIAAAALAFLPFQASAQNYGPLPSPYSGNEPLVFNPNNRNYSTPSGQNIQHPSNFNPNPR